MAPITLKKRDESNNSDNNRLSGAAPSSRVSSGERRGVPSGKPTSSGPSATTSTTTRTTSREKDNNAKAKQPEDVPARRATSSSSSSSSASSRMSAKKEPANPETKDSGRKNVKTPPTATTEEKEKAVKTLPLPSQTLHKHKQAAVWTTGKKKHKTSFGSAYDSGSIPCRINHGGIKNQLQWTKEPDTLDFNPLLVTCVEGFQETEHPFVFLARTMFRELMKLDDAREKTLAILPQVIPPLRVALMSTDDDIFLMALEATRTLSDVVEDEMNTYLPKITQQIHRKLLTKQLRTPVEETLATLERNGGKEALTIIRSKIPTYVSVH